MFTYDVGLNSAVSGLSYVYSSAVNLQHKHNDTKNLVLRCQVVPALSSASSQLYLTYSIAHNITSGTTFGNVITGSGTSLILSSGTSEGGEASNGCYNIPLTIVPHSGLTIPLKGIPAIKIGAKTNKATQGVSIILMVG